jgi:Glyoxalase-like domain
MPKLPQLDHTVINVRYQMDQAEASFRDLGFHLTDRGYHTLGSINHLMMFGTDYLELIGLPETAASGNSGRPDIENSPFGINGLVFKTSNVDETYEHLQEIGLAGDPPKAFSRPVELADGTFDACFRTVHVRNGAFPGGRVYFCEHGTPELVWRPEWQQHDNGALGMPEFVVASDDYEAEASAMAKLLRSDVGGSNGQLSVKLDGSMISFLSCEAYRDRYGDVASDQSERRSIFGALVLQTKDLAAIRRLSSALDTPKIDEAKRVVIREGSFDSVLEFVG